MQQSMIMRNTLISTGLGILKPLYGATTISTSSARTASATTKSFFRNEMPNLETTPSIPTSTPSSSVVNSNSTGRARDGDNYRLKVTRRDLRFIFPEFLPDPEPRFRNRIVERLMRRDMLRRRNIVEIPEFYVGSVVAVTVSDKNAPSSNKEGHALLRSTMFHNFW